MALENGWQFEKPKESTGRKILIVGAGPSGLSAAYQLTRMGHSVEIREAGPVAGGMIHFGIPAYRMPRDGLQAEIDRIENLGVKITLNHRVEDVLAEKEEGGFDAVFVAVGAHISKKIDIPNRDAGKKPFVLDSLAPSIPLREYAYNENRYKILTKTNPEEAERLMQMAQESVERRWATYEHLAKQEPGKFESAG